MLGRTHLQDATPLTLGQEPGGYVAQLDLCNQAIRHALSAVHTLALGGTAVGTGLNTHPAFGARVVQLLAQALDLPLSQAGNLFAAMAACACWRTRCSAFPVIAWQAFRPTKRGWRRGCRTR